jgi:hypothetical protein
MQIQKKCPNCGALIPSLSLKCTECDYVFSQESESSEIAREAINRLQSMLKDIEMASKKVSKRNLARAKATIITTFTVPNTKEAMISFLILAFSNIESSSETQDRAITMAWEARAISTYNLLKLQQDSDPQIEAVLQKYAILENKKELAKIDGRSKRTARKRKVATIIVFVLMIFSTPFVLGVIEKLNYDPIFAAIEEGRYDEAIERINNDEKLKQSVDFYIDLLASSSIASASTKVDIDSVTGTRTKTLFYTDGSKDINKCDYQDYRKNIERIRYDSVGSIEYHIIDSLKLMEKLWSIEDSPNDLASIEGLYLCDSFDIHLDSLGRCDTLTLSNNSDKATYYFTFDNQNYIIQQDVYTEQDTITVNTSVTNNGLFFVDIRGNGAISQFVTRTYNEQYSMIGYTKKWSLWGNDYLIEKTHIQEYSRLWIYTQESIPNEKLQGFDFDADLVVITKEVRNPLSGKGVILDYTKLVLDKNDTE